MPDAEPTAVAGIASGSLWSALGLVAPLVASLLVTPPLVRYFGVAGWGILALVQGVSTFLVSFDGGVGASAMRWFAVRAGEGDHDATTRLIVTLVVVVTAVTTLGSVAAWVALPHIVGVLHTSPGLRPPTVALLRVAAPLVGLSVIRSLLTSLVNAHRGFARGGVANTAAALTWIGGLGAVAVTGGGLADAAWAFVAESVVGVAILVPAAVGIARMGAWGLLGGPALRDFFGYGARMQVGSLFTVASFGLDALLIAAFLPLRDVGYYDLGAGLALQLRGAATVALAPALTALGRRIGSDPAGALAMVGDLQRTWVLWATAWSAAAIGSIGFGVTAWLGPGLRPSGVVAVVLMVGYLFNLLPGMSTAYVMAAGRAGLLLRVMALTSIVNLVLTVPGVALGLYGVVGATTVAMVVGSLWLLRTLRHRVAADFPSFLADVPVVGAAAVLVGTVVLELVVRPVVPSGAPGLVACAAPAGAALAAFALVEPAARASARGLLGAARLRIPAGRRSAAG